MANAVTPNSIVTPQVPQRFVAQMTTASTASTFIAAFTCSATASKVYGIFVMNSDTGSHTVSFALNNGTATFVQNAVSAAASAGNNGSAAAVNAMSVVNWPGLGIDSDGNPYFLMVNGDTLMVAPQSTLGLAASVLNVHGSVQNF